MFIAALFRTAQTGNSQSGQGWPDQQIVAHPDTEILQGNREEHTDKMMEEGGGRREKKQMEAERGE